jgi:transcription antitermination factor NusG
VVFEKDRKAQKARTTKRNLSCRTKRNQFLFFSHLSLFARGKRRKEEKRSLEGRYGLEKQIGFSHIGLLSDRPFPNPAKSGLASCSSFCLGVATLRWHAAYCESRREMKARDGLLALGLEVFFPFERLTQRRKLRGGVFRIETVERPVFPNYLFVKTDAYMAAEDVVGVSHMVASRGRPLVVPEAVIGLLRAAADQTGMVSARDISKISFSFGGRIGDRFAFKKASPLNGLIGRISSIARLDDTGTISAWVEMFGGEREVVVPHSLVSLLSAAAAA